MSTIKLENIQTRTGSGTITIGASGETVEVASGVTTNLKNGATLSDNILFDTASKGIYLGVTTATASNLLDDYEEGTFTPELADASSGGNAATGDFDGRYIKIGNKVTVNIRIVNINKTGLTAGNAIYIRGFPFTAASPSSIYSIGSVLTDNFTFSGYIISQLQGGESYANLKDISSGAGDSTMIVSDITTVTVSDLLITQTYFTD